MTASVPARPILRDDLRDGKTLLLTCVTIAETVLVDIIALAGFDCIMLDQEHGRISVEHLPALIGAAHRRQVHAMVRVRENNAALIGAALDAGADAVLVPQIGSAGEARAAIAAAKFAPRGTRGANPWVPAAQYAGDAGWFARANDATAVVLMIEGAGGLVALPDILALPDLGGIFIGPVDLSQALGVPGEIRHPRVVETVRAIAQQARRARVATMAFAPTVEVGRFWQEQGVGGVAIGVDGGIVFDRYRDIARDFHA